MGIVAAVWNGVVGVPYQVIEDRYVRQVDWRTVIVEVDVETQVTVDRSPEFLENIWIRGTLFAGMSGR